MRAPLPVSLALALTLACSRPQPTDTEPSPAADTPTSERAEDAVRLEAGAATFVARALGELGLEAQADAGRVTVGEQTWVVDVEIEHAMIHDGQFVLAAAFRIELDGAAMPVFTAGAIGIGRDANEAGEVALQEWFGQYGGPIAFAWAKRSFPDRVQPPAEGTLAGDYYIPLRVGGRPVFASPVGLRGEVGDVEALTSDAAMLGLIDSIAALAQGEGPYHTLTVQVSVEGTQVTDAGCRVDGVDSSELFGVLAQRSWPEGAPGYMYKQFFVFY